MMKNKVFLLLALFPVFMACEKKTNEALLKSDCTGFYLEVDDEDYRICNYEDIDTSRIGETVDATYKKVDSCPSDTLIYCELYHPFESHIELISME